MARQSKKIRKDLKSIIYPYLFVLSEGKTIEDNPLDFRLLMFYSASQEVLVSPLRSERVFEGAEEK